MRRVLDIKKDNACESGKNEKMKKIVTFSAEETQAAGAEYAKELKDGDVVLLSGGLGAGKTTFVKGVARGLGITAEVTSPTYAYMNDYGRLHHFDCYRLSSGEDAEALGLTALFGDGICLIEWPENIAQALPQTVRRVVFSADGDKREIVFFDETEPFSDCARADGDNGRASDKNDANGGGKNEDGQSGRRV